jgi:hypothetical protein
MRKFAMTTARATFEYTPGVIPPALDFVKRTRSELRSLRTVRIWKDHVHIIDVNKDFFEIRGIGYLDADIVPILRLINAAFDPAKIHAATEQEYKEFDTGRRHPWAEDRVM